MKRQEIYFSLLLVVLGFGMTTFFVVRYDLLGPDTSFNDANYYYVTMASAVYDGSGMPRFGHPGLFFMSLLSWCFVILKKLSLISTLHISEFQQSLSPFSDLIQLFFAGRLVGIGLVMGFTGLVYLVVKILTQNRSLSTLTAFYVFFQVGLFENMFMVRSELTSVIFLFLPIYILLRFRNITNINQIIGLMFLSGFLYGCSLSAKILSLLFAPIALIPLIHFTRRALPLTPAKYAVSFLSLTILVALLSSWWLDSSGFSSLMPFVPMRYHDQLNRLSTLIFPLSLSILGLVLVLGILLMINWHRLIHPLLTLRTVFLLLLANVAGFVGSLYTASLTGAEDKMTWGRLLVHVAWGETLYDTFVRQAYNNNPLAVDWSLILNHDLLFLLSHTLTVWIFVILSFYFGERSSRLRIIALSLFLWGISFVTSRRGSHPAYYYHIYFLPIIVLMISESISIIQTKIKSHRGILLALVFIALFFANDMVQIFTFRDKLFSYRSSATQEMSVLDAWDRDVFFEKVVQPRFCEGLVSKEQCYQKAGEEFHYAMMKYGKLKAP